MNNENFETYPVVEKWLLRIDAKDSTRESYLYTMKSYCNLIGKTPSELINEAKTEQKNALPMDERMIDIYFLKFKKYLQEQKLAPLTIKLRLTGIQSFYKNNYIEIPIMPRGAKVKPLEENKEIPTKKDIQEVLKVCDLLERAAILVGVSSGLAMEEIRNLKVGDFTKGYDPETGITILKLRRGKAQFDFITFLSPEASLAVIDYLKYRNRKPYDNKKNHIDQLRKQYVYCDDNYLFIGRRIPPEFLDTFDDELRKFERESFVCFYDSIATKAQKNAPPGRWNVIRSHNFRKFFNSALLNAGCDFFHVEYWMGHTLDNTRAAYFQPDPDKLKEMYSKYTSFLTIQKELDVSESPIFTQLKTENEDLKLMNKITMLERRAEREELQEIRAELEAEKKSNEAWKSEMHQELLNAIAINEQKKAAYSGEPFTDEQLSELEKAANENPRPIVDIAEEENPMKNLHVSPEDIPEEESDIIKRIFNSKEKKE
jgi:integrase